MAKKETQNNSSKKPSKDTVLLRVIGIEGTIKEMPRKQAERLLEYERHSGLIAHELYEPDNGTNTGTDKKPKE